MKLKYLSEMITQKIDDGDFSKTELAEKLNLPISTFCYRIDNGCLQLQDVARLKKMGVFNFKDFSSAISKDFNAPVIIRRPKS